MEVATLAGGALLSATFEFLLSKLNSFVSEWLNLPEKVRSKMENWKNLLPQIGALLEHAEEKQVRDRLVKLWLARLKDLFYDMEDILDEVEIDAKRFELFAKAQASTSKPRKLIFSKLFDKVERFTAKGDRKMASRVEDITARLQRIKADISELGLVHLRTMKTGDKSRRGAAERPSTTPLLENHVCGREDDQEAILRMLLCDDGRHEPYSVIPIVGMGGSGKTTLARLVYNNDKSNSMFGLKAWVCISEEFDVSQITRSILEQVTKQTCDFKDLTLLQERLKEKFLGQKFLLVLDDIWNEKFDLWDNLQKPFLSGASGSKIIITTRDENIGKMMKGNDEVYHLALLKNDACLSLFARYALGAENFDAYPGLKGVGEKIVEKCKRLPLAVKTLSGLLRGKIRHAEWESILNSDIWDWPEHNSDILPALRLSYNYLPSHLKRCFAYCSLFPKDYEFEESELVLLWMAEGLVQHQPHGMKKMLDIGRQYFRELLSRAFFQRLNKDESLFVMHDLIVDLSFHVAGETCCTLEIDGERSNASLQKAHHLSLFPCGFEVSKRFEFLEKKKNLRSFMWLKNRGREYYLSNTLLQDLIKNLKCLRVLSLPQCRITKLSDSMADLKHLRYINLSGACIKSLPDSVGYLIYLQTLLLKGCFQFSELPATVANLLDLQHLDIAQTPSLKEIPSEISNLTNLVTLSKFIVGNARGPRLKDLKNLLCLQGQLSILDLHNVFDANDAKEANLYEIKGLNDLSLEWYFDSQNPQNGSNEKQVLNWLKPHQTLKKLSIKSFGGLEFPPWIGDPSFTNLEFLKLSHCQRSTSLPSLERLPQLKELIITGMHALQTMPLEFDGENSSLAWAFPALESLKIRDCPMLVGKFPKCIPFLKKLELAKCPELIYSPVSLPLLEKLDISECSEAVLKSIVDLNSLKTLSIKKISKLIWLPKSFVESLIALEDIKIRECDELTCLWEEGANMVNLTCLENISVENCPVLASLTGKEQGFLSKSIQTLNIYNCEALESLPSEIMMAVRLEALRIRKCPALRMFPGGKLPTTLKVLQILECEKLESLPEGILMNNGDASQVSRLEELRIDSCPCLKSLPSGHLSNSFNLLCVRGCRMLEYCTEHIYIDGGSVNSTAGGGINMEIERRKNGPTSLQIEDCDGLESFCPAIPNLKELTIEECKNLKSCMMHDLTSLDELCIINCPGIQRVSDSGFPPNLTRLVIDGCAGIESIPDGGLLPNLTDLQIVNCPGIDSIPEGGLPPNLTFLAIEECPRIESIPACGLPPNLRELTIDCENLKQPIQEWNLSKLTSLLSLEIYWICPDPDVLPTSLTSLMVGKVENTKSISRRLLRNLNSLQDLRIVDWPKLQSLPKEVLPPSLQRLRIWRCPNFQSLPNKVLPPSLQQLNIQICPNFQSLPKEGLPPSLGVLVINNCPLLKCLEEKGDYWPLIAHIPDTFVLLEGHEFIL